jgi:hypothetical protein
MEEEFEEGLDEGVGEEVTPWSHNITTFPRSWFI